MRRFATLASALALALGLALAACGSGGSDGGDPAPAATVGSGATGTSPSGEIPAFPVTVLGTNGDVEIAARPERIVSLSPSATEDLFAIGAGDQVIAVDDQSDHPAGVPTTELSGFEPNVEAIAGYQPDLVVFATEPGDLGSALEGLGITALQLDAPADLDGAFAQIEVLGQATGHADEATALVTELRERVEEVMATTAGAEGLTFYYELDDTYYSVTSRTFIGQLFAMLGLQNIADEAQGAGGGYPQLSAEFIVESDPDLVFLADTECCDQTAETVAARPGWDDLTAVTTGGVVELDDDVASRWGPRVVDLLQQFGAAAAAAAEAEAAA